MQIIKGSHIIGFFDVQVDSNHRWDEDRMLEVDVYPVSLSADGTHETDGLTTLAHVEVPAGDFCEDTWLGSTATDEELSEFPEQVRAAFKQAVAEATAKQVGFNGEFKYALGDTVFITEHRFPGEVEGQTVNGGYIVNMAGSGELDEFAEDELEDYDQERWHRA
jgi:hypothetical protein